MKWVHVRQRDSRQCGIACLSMLCIHYGQHYDIEELEDYCPASKDGVSLLAISETANKLGLDNISVKLSLGKLEDAPKPCLLHWNQNHFVILYKTSRDGQKFYISDPAKGNIVYSKKDFASHWKIVDNTEDEGGIVTFFSPTDIFYKNKPKKRVERKSVYILSAYLKKYRVLFSHVLFGLILGCILQLIVPFLTQAIVDVGIKNNDISIIWLILVGELMIVTGSTATDFIRRWLLLHISMRINISILSDFIIKLLRLPMPFFETKQTGDILQRMRDHSRVQSFLTNQALNILFTVISFLVFGIVLFLYSNLLFYIFFAFCIVYSFWILMFLPKRKEIDYKLFDKEATNQNTTYQLVTNLQEIKLQGCEKRRRWEWEDAQADLFLTQMDSLKMQQTQEAGSIFINELKNIFITILSASAVINGEMTLGSMLAIQYIIGQLNSPIDQFMNFIYAAQDVGISLDRINEIHHRKNEEDDHRNTKDFGSVKSIEIKDLCFKYDIHSLSYTLNKINLNIPQGKVTAIVGASGSGKTTLIKLLLGYYPPLSGTISIAGRDISDYNLGWWRHNCGVVMQDGVLFSESIERNIAIEDGEIDGHRLVNSAELACIHDFIENLPVKYKTIVGRTGIGLSQGQKQRILIARAIYKNPDFIFLDEATNSLDAKNESVIIRNLEEFYKGRTVVIVAHRLSTVKNADNIIVMEKGEIIESGNHSSLIESKGSYYNLVRSQLEIGC